MMFRKLPLHTTQYTHNTAAGFPEQNRPRVARREIIYFLRDEVNAAMLTAADVCLPSFAGVIGLRS